LLSIGLIPENELTKNMEASIDDVTNGAIVNQHLQTSVEGVFACGNVLHVHDLVDYVTLEGNKAAIYACRYINKQVNQVNNRIKVVASDGIRYVMPQYIDLSKKDEKIKIYFRSQQTYKDVYTYAKCKDEFIKKKKNLRLLPAEMEYLEISSSDINGDTIYIGVEENA